MLLVLAERGFLEMYRRDVIKEDIQLEGLGNLIPMLLIDLEGAQGVIEVLAHIAVGESAAAIH